MKIEGSVEEFKQILKIVLNEKKEKIEIDGTKVAKVIAPSILEKMKEEGI